MKIIYADSLFLLNLVIDYLLLACTAMVCGLSRKRLRYFLAATVGAIYAAAVCFPGMGFLTRPIIKLSAAGLMSYIAYGGEKSFLHCALVFAAVSAAFGGFIYFITLSGGYPAFDMRTLFLSFALCYLLLSLVFRYRAGRTEKSFAEVELFFNGKSTRFMAMVDTGNGLTDPISGDRVLIACPHALNAVLNGDEIRMNADPVSYVSEGSFPGRVRLIPYSAVGVKGLLAAFRPDRVLIDGEEQRALAAVSDSAWGDGFEGIV